MQLLLAGLFACGCVSLVDGPLWPRAESYIDTAMDCSQSADPGNCRHARDTWKSEYDAATTGQYQGQRNVAFCLSTGCDDAIQPDRILGCAWRIVVVNSQHTELDNTDTVNLKQFCGAAYIDQAGRHAAEAQAKAMLELLGKQPGA